MGFIEMLQDVSSIDLTLTLEWATGALEDTDMLRVFVGNGVGAFYLRWRTLGEGC